MADEETGKEEGAAGYSVRVLDGCAAPSKKSKRFKDRLETRYEDAGYKEDRKARETAFFFQEGMVIFRERTATADTLDGLLEQTAEFEEFGPEELLAAYDKEITRDYFCFKIIIGDEKVMEGIQDKMWIAKLLFKETGSLGAAEMGMLATATLDFG